MSAPSKVEIRIADAASKEKPVWALPKAVARAAGHKLEAAPAHIIETMRGQPHVI